MALVDAVMKAALLALYEDMSKYVMDDDEFAERMAELTDTQIKTAGVPSGSVVVSVVGDAAGIPNPAEILVV
jgi:molybdopterin-biosynthesis enzyme MoeA-like protein